jgi:hypothetical protein
MIVTGTVELYNAHNQVHILVMISKLLRDKGVRLFVIVAVAVTCTHHDDRNHKLSR